MIRTEFGKGAGKIIRERKQEKGPIMIRDRKKINLTGKKLTKRSTNRDRVIGIALSLFA